MFSKNKMHAFLKSAALFVMSLLVFVFSSIAGYKFAKNYFSNIEFAYYQIVDDIKNHILDFETELIKNLKE